MSNTSKGFVFIEFMVSVFIVVFLTTTGGYYYGNMLFASKKAEETTQMLFLKKALNNYYVDWDQYPQTNGKLIPIGKGIDVRDDVMNELIGKGVLNNSNNFNALGETGGNVYIPAKSLYKMGNVLDPNAHLLYCSNGKHFVLVCPFESHGKQYYLVFTDKSDPNIVSKLPLPCSNRQ